MEGEIKVKNMLPVRAISENIEQQTLAAWATKSADAVRDMEENIDDLRTSFQRDRDRIIHSTPFRKLKHKTQVYLSPGDHYRTRLTHSMEVSQIARTIARALRLNEDLTEAAALGHDLGHTPFGHAGERAINAYTGHFKHNEQSLRVVEVYGRKGKGLNLTRQVRDAILNHTGTTLPQTLEGQVVRRCDRIAYLCHDFDDGCKVGIIGPEKLPGIVAMRLGTEPSQILDVLVRNIVELSLDKPQILIDKYYDEAIEEFRNFMFDYIYYSPQLIAEHNKAEHVVMTLMDLYMGHPHLLPQEYSEIAERFGLGQTVVDFVDGLTDAGAVQLFNKHYIPII